MTENPYASPESNTGSPFAGNTVAVPVHDNGNRLDSLSRTIVVICSLWFAMMVVGRFLDDNPPPLLEMLSFYAITGFAPALSLCGALFCLHRKHYPVCVVGAICLVIPILGPCCGLTIPIGIWWLVLLRRPDVFASFAAAPLAGPTNPDNADDAIAHAAHLGAIGEWEAAISAYQDAANRWPEYSEYIGNCIADITCKRDAAT